jgi:hypothetical protein
MTVLIALTDGKKRFPQYCLNYHFTNWLFAAFEQQIRFGAQI